MFSIPEYRTIEQLHDSHQSIILRAIQEADGLPVILKVLKDVQPTPERIARFKREYELAKELDLAGVVRVHNFIYAANHWLFIQEDFGGESLSNLGLSGRIEIGEFLSIAEAIAGHVAVIHQKAVIHKDLNPANIVLERRSGIVKLIDFGISTRLSRENVAFDHLSLVEGTPAYLSPEQTGRINQQLDHRTDLYSLGCTFYELLAGRPPFQTEDLAEMLHSHLARVPDPLVTLRPDIPPALAAIVEKLLAKNVSDRYQSARGLQLDLARCRREWNAHGRIDFFRPGAKDVAARLSPPARLFGRDKEIVELLSTFARVSEGGTELLLVSGQSGVGKSALAKELYRPVTASRGFFVSGKFDQFQRDTPYQPILSALDRLLSHVLMDPPAKMAAWAAEIQTATGRMLPALTAVLPRLELLSRGLSPVVGASGDEVRHRFVDALSGLIRVFAKPEHPLVLFIDDLQWADSASLDLLKRLMVGTPIPNLLILGAYRDHEVGAAHPLRAALSDIRAAGIEVRDIPIGALDASDTAALLGATLSSNAPGLQEFASIVHQKTGGNPLFIQTLLDVLVLRRLLWPNVDFGGWEWDAQGLRVLELSDNVVDLLIGSLRELPEETRDLLILAACVGNHFELGLLAAVAGKKPNEVATALTPAMVGNYLIPTTGDYRLLEAGMGDLNMPLDVAYKFAHDRIQQAAYGLSVPRTHAAIHLRIGRAMRVHYPGKEADARLLAAVNQLNQAAHLVDNAAERAGIASLNLEAGRKAKGAAANAAALDYFEQGLVFLGGSRAEDASAVEGGGRISPALHEHAFRTNYSVALALTEEAAAAAYRKPDFGAADLHIEAVLLHAVRHADRIRATQVRIDAQVARYQLSEAIVSAREALGPLGIELPMEPTDADIEAQLKVIANEIGTRTPIELADLPTMKESEPEAALHVLASVAPAAFLTQQRLLPLVAGQMVLLTLLHGVVQDSASAFLFHGLALCAREDFVRGYEFGRLAEILVEKYQFKSQMADLAVLGGCYVFHWKRPSRDSIQKMRDGYRAGVESGNIGSGVNCLQCSSAVGLWTGGDLSVIDGEYVESTQALEKHKQVVFLTWLRQYHQVVQNLRGLNENPTRLQGSVYDEVAEMPIHQRTYDMTALYNVSFNRAVLCYHFHNYPEALLCTRALERGNQPGAIVLPIAILYQCLSLLATHIDATPENQPAILEEAAALIARMKRWGEACPANYAHKYHLMAAEFDRIKGKHAEARDHYDTAIDLARKHEYLNEEGLALERAALFFLERDNARLAGHYMRDAYYTYGVWGATAKLKFLRSKYGYLLERETSGRTRSKAASLGERAAAKVTTTTSDLGDLDLATVLSATRAITKETELNQLLQTVMRVSLENAGAERGFLVLARGDQLIVKVHAEIGQETLFESLSLALHDQEGIAKQVVQYVARTAQPVLLENASEEGMFVGDPHIQKTGCKSLLCLPILQRGSLVAVSYLENNRAASVFNSDRLDVLTLLMGQAAVSIENALLKESEEVREFHFRVGGSLPADSPAYVRRKADEMLADNIRRGELSYVFNTRQMGKSSLRVYAVDKLAKAGVACVSVDLTSIGATDVTAEQWYAGVARVLVNGLGLQKGFDLRHWWRDHVDLSPVQRLEVLFDEVILEGVEKPIAVFVDEVDAVLGLPFSPDDFFALIRLFYNRRAEDPRYARLTFVLLGVATPADLIQDKRRTPFNIGQAIPLAGFRFDEARNLVSGLAAVGNGEALLRAVLDWSGGQPFLTQKLCHLTVEAESRAPAGREREWMANLVRERVIDKWRHRDEPEHLKTIEARILHVPEEVPALLSLYRRVLEGREINAEDSAEETALLLSGLVTRTFDKVRVGSPIYEAVFNDAWIQSVLDAQKPVATSSPD